MARAILCPRPLPVQKNHGIRNDGSRTYIHMHARIDRYLACSIIREVKILRVFVRPRWGDSRLRL